MPGRPSIVTMLMLSQALTSACLSAGSSATATEGTGEDSTTTATTSTDGTDGASSTSAGATAIPTTSTTSASTATGCDSACDRDGGPIGGFECDQWTQDCPAGEKCMPYSNDSGGAWNSTRCSPIDRDPDDVGEPCRVQGSGVSGIDSCVKAAICWDVDPETNTGVCVGFCEGNESKCVADPASCCPPKYACVVSAMAALILCLEICDPIVQDCFDPAEICYPIANSFQCGPDVSGDMGAVGDPCEYINACDPGTYCGDPTAYPGCDPMAGGCCIPLCELDNPDCVPGTECEPWYDPMDTPPGYENLGACVIPS